MTKVLLHVPVVDDPTGVYAKARQSWLDLDKTGIELDYLLTRHDPLAPTADFPDPIFKNLDFKMEKARQLALAQDYDYLFNVEHDHILSRDALRRLLAHDVPVVSGLYRHRPSRRTTFILGPVVRAADGAYRALDYSEINDGLMPVEQVGFGCLLLRRDVLEKVAFQWGDDGRYCWALKDEGFRVMLDPDVRTVHIDIDGTEVVV